LQRFKILSSRLNRNYSLEKLKRGRKNIVKEKHIEFLKEWFSKDKNVGQPFKSAYSDLKL